MPKSTIYDVNYDILKLIFKTWHFETNFHSQTGEQKTLAIARNLAGRLRILSRNVAASVRVLPENLRTRVEEARDLADSVYKSFEEVGFVHVLLSCMNVCCLAELHIWIWK